MGLSLYVPTLILADLRRRRCHLGTEVVWDLSVDTAIGALVVSYGGSRGYNSLQERTHVVSVTFFRFFPLI